MKYLIFLTTFLSFVSCQKEEDCITTRECILITPSISFCDSDNDGIISRTELDNWAFDSYADTLNWDIPVCELKARQEEVSLMNDQVIGDMEGLGEKYELNALFHRENLIELICL